MPEIRELPLYASSYAREPTELRLRVLHFDRAERFRRAAGISLPLLGGALVSLPLPGWHLAAVPGFLAAAVILGIRRLRQATRVEGLAGACPACAREQDFPAPPRLELPATLRCPTCGEFIQLADSHSARELR